MPPSTDVIRSRMLGALYGLTVCDALGGPYEFRSRGTYQPTSEMEESETFSFKGKPLRPGSWTDDSSMMLCMLQSLVEKHGELDWIDVANKFVRWYSDGYMSVVNVCFDIGMATRTALVNYHQLVRQKSAFPPSPNANPLPNQSGNGSIMRLAPIPIIFHNSDGPTLYEKATTSSKITHSSSTCMDACVLMSSYIVGFLHAEESDTLQQKKEKVLDPTFAIKETTMPLKSNEIVAIHNQALYKTMDVSQVRTSGYVVHTLEAALWALWKARTFEEGILLILPLGEDVDTVGAVYGQMAGSLFGVEAIPERWINALQRKAEILDPGFHRLVDIAMRYAHWMESRGFV